VAAESGEPGRGGQDHDRLSDLLHGHLPLGRARATAPLTADQTRTIQKRVRLMIEITARDGRYRKGLTDAAARLSPQEASIIADLERHGMQVPQLRDVLCGGHVLVDNPDLYDDWHFEGVSHLRISSHHHDVDKKAYPDIGMRGPLVREKLHGRTSSGTWMQLEKTPAAMGARKIPTWNDVKHLWDYVVYRVTRSNVGPWGLSKVTERRPMYLSPRLTAGASVTPAVAHALAETFRRIDATDDTTSASRDLAALVPPPVLEHPMQEIREQRDERSGRGLFGSSQVWVTEAPSRVAGQVLAALHPDGGEEGAS
jgi:hypothetical protein